MDLLKSLDEEMQWAIESRHEAADVLQDVADAGRAGFFPSDVTCKQLGQALHRICMNAPEKNPLRSLVKGYLAAQREYKYKNRLK